MDRPVIIIEMPILTDEAVVGIQTFLQELIFAFESHYFSQLQRYYHNAQPDDTIENSLFY